MGRMRYPSLSLHGIEGAFSAPGAKTVIVRYRLPSRCLHQLNSFLFICTTARNSARSDIPLIHPLARIILKSLPGKFSVRLVPDMTPENVDVLVIKYLKDEFSKLGTKSKLSVENLHGGKPWLWVDCSPHSLGQPVADFMSSCVMISTELTRTIGTTWRHGRPLRFAPHAFMLQNAANVDQIVVLSQHVYKQTPDLTREGGSIPVTLTFAEALGPYTYP